MIVDLLILLFVVYVIVGNIVVAYQEYKINKEIQKKLGRYGGDF